MGGAHGGMPYKNIFGGQMCLGVMISLYMERPVKKTIPSGDSL